MRWNYCLFIDDMCLRSLKTSFSLVKLTTDWHGKRAETVAEGYEDGETDDEMEEVGWMYTEVSGRTATYVHLMDACHWEVMYMRQYAGYVEDT